jgi:deoxyribose-phosphate aldolase
MIKHGAMNEKDDFSGVLGSVAAWHGRACELLDFHPVRAATRLEFSSFAKRIEHTLLKPDSSKADVTVACEAAKEYGFRSVCCFPKDVARCRDLLGGTDILIVTVLNFPLAGCAPSVVDFECRGALEDGADEVDMVADLRALIHGNLGAVRDGVARIVASAGSKPVKVILETGLLTKEQIVFGVAAAEAGGALYVKTSTGFGPRGASVDDVAIMRAAVGGRLGVKASGGIKRRAFAKELVDAGADLIGTSSGPECV